MVEPNLPTSGPMNAMGVGVELVDIERLEQLMRRHGERAIRRLLT